MKFERRRMTVDAVQLTEKNWDEVKSFVQVGNLMDGRPTGIRYCMLPDGNPVMGYGDKVGLLIPHPKGLIYALDGDWIVKNQDGSFSNYPDAMFIELFEPC